MALFAKKHSQYAAAKIFNVARRRIFDWMRQIPKLEELIAKGHMKKMTGRGPKNRDIDQALYNWYCERQAPTQHSVGLIIVYGDALSCVGLECVLHIVNELMGLSCRIEAYK